jgi:signal transduction histidine kinase
MENHLENEQRNHLLARVRSATSSLDLLVKNLADLYLIDDKRLKPRCRMIDPKAVLAGVADRYELEARLKGIELRPEFEGISSAYLDPMHLERIVTNLLASAFRRTTAGVVRLRACSRGADFIIEISDSGAEATPAEIEGVFARPDLSAGAEDERSPALSRYIAKCLVEADGGRILATSNDGAGLRLTIQLPAAIALAA